MPIYFGSNFAREPFQFDSVGNDWEQESVTRPEVSAVPLFTDEGGRGRGNCIQQKSGCFRQYFVKQSYD